MSDNKNSGIKLYERAKSLIPGGTQLLSKRPEMFLPGGWPAYYKKAEGCHIWDMNDQKFLDMSYMGIGACVLGYADPDVNQKVIAAVSDGSMSTLNCPDEIDLAELLVDLHPWAQKVRFARTGGEAMSVAVRIARASTGKSNIVFCGYHGWHDWYLASNLGGPDALQGHLLPGLAPNGVPQELESTAKPFAYNDLQSLDTVIDSYNGAVAAIVMEPLRSTMPDPGFLQGVRKAATDCGAILIFDEITSGFRITNGGAHLVLGQHPDIAVFAKGMSNGYPMSAIIGIEDVMDAAQSSFISSTYWTEKIGPVAAAATIRKFIEENVAEQLIQTGAEMKNIWKRAATESGLSISVTGIDPLASFNFESECGNALKTALTKKLLARNILGTKSFYASLSHRSEHLAAYEHEIIPIFCELKKMLDNHTLSDYLPDGEAHTGFHRLT